MSVNVVLEAVVRHVGTAVTVKVDTDVATKARARKEVRQESLHLLSVEALGVDGVLLHHLRWFFLSLMCSSFLGWRRRC